MAVRSVSFLRLLECGACGPVVLKRVCRGHTVLPSPTPGTFGSIWRHFWYHNSGRSTRHLCIETRAAAQHHTVHGTSPPQRNVRLYRAVMLRVTLDLACPTLPPFLLYRIPHSRWLVGPPPLDGQGGHIPHTTKCPPACPLPSSCCCSQSFCFKKSLPCEAISPFLPLLLPDVGELF